MCTIAAAVSPPKHAMLTEAAPKPATVQANQPGTMVKHHAAAKAIPTRTVDVHPNRTAVPKAVTVTITIMIVADRAQPAAQNTAVRKYGKMNCRAAATRQAIRAKV